MWKFFSNLRERLGKRPVISLTSDEVGIVIESSNSQTAQHIRWDGIDEIHAFKLDLGTVDDIRLALHDSTGWHELSERDQGFMDVVSAMQQQFPTIPELWYLEVMLPAFERNQRVLWRRGN